MKSLITYIEESQDVIINPEIEEIIKFLQENYSGDAVSLRLNSWDRSRISGFYINPDVNKDGKYVVDYKGYIVVKNKNITRLTNDLFVFGKGSNGKRSATFSCENCNKLETLEGAPVETSDSFNCSGCTSLKSLEGAPKKVGYQFICNYCTSLKSLKGAPKVAKVRFEAYECGFTLSDMEKSTKSYNYSGYIE